MATEIKKGSLWREKGKAKALYFRAVSMGPKAAHCEVRSNKVGRYRKGTVAIPRADFGTKLVPVHG